MKYAADFRKNARDALNGNWKTAILTGFVASLIGANITDVGNISINNNPSNSVPNELQITDLFKQFYPVIFSLLAIVIILTIVSVIIGGAGKLGYAKFNLNLIDRKPAALSDLFSQFNRLGTGFCMNFLIVFYTFLWTLLFIIPGIIKAYSYSMTPYILSEHPEMSVNEAITESRRIMQGNKGRLFCLQLSFIGWEILCLLPILILIPLIFSGIGGKILWITLSFCLLLLGSLLLTPYKEAAQASFYREVSNTNLSSSISDEQEYEHF